MEVVWLALQDSGLAQIVRSSVWLYPAANVVHVLAVMGFFALVAGMHLQALGLASVALAEGLRLWAVGLFGLIAVTGFLLLAPEATAIAANPVFGLKALAIGLGLVNILAHARVTSAAAARATALMSLGIWLGVAALGRLIAYF